MPSAPYGSWRSPITAELIASSSIGVSQPAIDGEEVYWLETRPTEGGRSVIVRRSPDGRSHDVNPAPLNARTRVHEYGGGDYLVHQGNAYFANFADQRLYLARLGADPVPLTHSDGMRYADFEPDTARERLLCVREDHSAGSEPTNSIIAVDLATGNETVLVQGHDFFAYPRLSPDGAHLAWIAWDHPNMPWDGTRLYIARIDAAGSISEPLEIAGGPTESVLQPTWSPDGRLAFVSDRTGWWNLYLWSAGAITALVTDWTATRIPPPKADSTFPPSVSMPEGSGAGADSNASSPEAEFAKPLWQLGSSAYAFIDAATIICTYCVRGSWRLARLDIPTGAVSDLDTPYTDIGAIHTGPGRAVFIAGSPSQRAALVRLDLSTLDLSTVKSTSEVSIDQRYLSTPETIEYPTTLDGAPTSAFAFYYAPHNADYDSPEDEAGRTAGASTRGAGAVRELPPLLVISHGGPTAATSAVLSPRIQFWTSRGIAVLDINYGGSTGYGTEYRRRLNGRWGIVDVDDCVNAARYLVQRGDVDPARLAITGGSAGGYTTLCALTMRDLFAAGASYYGVAELEALARDTHKFESRYLDGLIGPYPAERALYVERSPISHVEGISCPVIFFQGLEDQIVPPNQAEMMVEALRRKGITVEHIVFEGEQHGFRRAENIKRSLEAELAFYGRIFDFLPH